MTMMNAWLLAGMLAFVPVAAPLSQGQGQGQGQGRQTSAQGGQRAGRGNLPAAGANVPVKQMQEIFDAFALVQAQRSLRLGDEDYGQFFPRMSRVYQLRRQHATQRQRVLNEIRLMYGAQASDDSLVEAIGRLDALDVRWRDEVLGARRAVDEVLTIRQRAGLRFFEEDMERRKIDFLTRSRQGGG
ncbi:MAG: hypothetical protein HQ485_00225 [Acidobacteria bacterium]|nr:hypothetical protein [Acidobacteriota bacterium]